jgi:hypothetical protein
MAQIIPFRPSSRPAGEDAAATFERDRAVFHLRLEGLSVEACAEQLNCTVEQVMASLDRMCCGSLPPKPRKPTA